MISWVKGAMHGKSLSPVLDEMMRCQSSKLLELPSWFFWEHHVWSMRTTYLTIENHLEFFSGFNLGIEVLSQLQASVDLIFKSHSTLFQRRELCLLISSGISPWRSFGKAMLSLFMGQIRKCSLGDSQAEPANEIHAASSKPCVQENAFSSEDLGLVFWKLFSAARQCPTSQPQASCFWIVPLNASYLD